MDNYFITKGDDNWKLTKQGNEHATLTADTKEAIISQMRIYMQDHPGSVKIQKANGRFQEERTYPKSADPKKTRG